VARTSTSRLTGSRFAACIRDALRLAGPPPGATWLRWAATSMREGNRALRRKRAPRYGPARNVDSRAAQEATDLNPRGRRRSAFSPRPATGYRSPPPARLRWAGPAQAGYLRPDPQPRHAQRLDSCTGWLRSRSPSRPAARARECSTWPAGGWSAKIAQICGISPTVLPEVADPGTAVGEGHGRRCGSDRPARGAPRVVAGGADTQLGLLGGGP